MAAMLLTNNIEKLFQERPIPVEKIVAEMAGASLTADPDDMQAILSIAHLNDVFDQLIAYPAMALLPAWGTAGIDRLCEFATNGPHRAVALSVLAAICLNRVPISTDVHFLRDSWDTTKKYSLDEKLVPYAVQRVRILFLDHLSDADMIGQLLSSISSQIVYSIGHSADAERLNFLMEILVDSHLILNRDILAKFKALLDEQPEREEQLQRFLSEHPVLLDPFVTELRSKHELGDDFITDYVIRRVNDEYVVVEIEKSTDQLFQKNGAFTAKLMTAVGQVRDFQAWISDNIAYAQSKLPGIRHPDGLVVIGRRGTLSPEMEKRLSEENFSRRGHIKIVTYDDLLSQAESVYRNTIERPVVLRSRDQKTI